MSLQPLILTRNGIRTIQSNLRKQMLNISTTAVRRNEQDACEEDVIIKEFEGGKGVFTLNRPKQLNTLNASMVCKIRKQLLTWKDNKYLIAIKGAGDKAFCAGGDVVAVTKDTSGETGKKFFREEYKLDALISSLEVPFAAFIGGIVMGGGVGISIFGQCRVATETSMFAMPETQIGFFPDVGVSYQLSRMPNKLGKFLALTGYRLKGYDLVHAGIATHFCTQDKLSELQNSLLCDFAKSCCSTPEEIIQEYHDMALKTFKDCQPPVFCLQEHLSAIETWFSTCTLEDALKKMSEDKSKFAADTLNLINKMSPLSLKVTYKQIKEACNLSVYDCFNTDYRIATKMMQCGDFAEGVRALLIDKDKKPKWKHSDISKVTDEEVANFFCPLPDNEELNLPNSICDPCEE